MRAAHQAFDIAGVWAKRFPDAAGALAAWQRLIEGNEFAHFAALRRVFPSADPVTVESGRTVTVSDLRGNNYRLIAALHYNRRLAYALRFLTHADHDREKWKEEL